MVIDMNEAQGRTLEQMRQVLAGTQELEFHAAADDEGRYAWVEQVLRRFGYRQLGRADRGAVLAYVQWWRSGSTDLALSGQTSWPRAAFRHCTRPTTMIASNIGPPTGVAACRCSGVDAAARQHMAVAPSGCHTTGRGGDRVGALALQPGFQHDERGGLRACRHCVHDDSRGHGKQDHGLAWTSHATTGSQAAAAGLESSL